MVNPLDFIKSAGKKANAEPETEPQDDAVVPETPAEPTVTDTASEEASVTPIAEAPEPVATNEPVASLAADTPQPRAGEIVGSSDRAAIEASAKALYTECLQSVGRFFKAASGADKGETPDPVELDTMATKIVQAMTDDHLGDALLALAVGAYPDEGRFIVPHSVNVAFLSQRVGRQLGLADPELHTLAFSALAHDVGTVRIARETFYKADSLTNEEWDQLRQRPTFSAEIIASLGAHYRAAAEIAHQVHERLDGNGYPRGLTVDSIALEASILGAVDIFEAFIHPRPYKKTVPAAAMYGVDNLMRMSHQFGDGVLKSLVRSVGLFPVGTFVRLNSGELARVLRGRSANPMRPEVEVVIDTQKRRLAEPRYIDLMATPHLYVFKPLAPEELVEFGL